MAAVKESEVIITSYNVTAHVVDLKRNIFGRTILLLSVVVISRFYIYVRVKRKLHCGLAMRSLFTSGKNKPTF